LAQNDCFLWGPLDDISGMKRTLGKVTKTPNQVEITFMSIDEGDQLDTVEYLQVTSRC
jgi:hypothetical protein